MSVNTVDATIDLTRSALVLIDLQNGIVGMPTAPLSGEEVVTNARRLADHFRDYGAPVVLLSLCFPEPVPGRVRPDVVLPLPESKPEGWEELVPGLGQHPNDVRLTKRGWGAFLGTDLDVTLRACNVSTIVIGGIATNLGVESTAREAMGLGYDVVVASDAVTSLSDAHHEFSIQHILPMVGRVRSTQEIIG